MFKWVLYVNDVELCRKISCCIKCFYWRSNVKAVKLLAFENQRHAENWTRHKLCGSMHDTSNGCIFHAYSMHAGDECSQPMCKVDNVWSCNTRKEIFGSPREACDLVWKDRPADDQLVVIKTHP